MPLRCAPLAPAAVLSAACLLAACASTSPSTQSKPSAARAPVQSGQVSLNTLDHDRGVWAALLEHHDKLRRTVRHTEQGVEALTESDDPAVAAKIVEHANAMQARMKAGAPVRLWDPVFAELFERREAIDIQIAVTDKGVRIAETSADPQALALLRAHAMGLSDFVREGSDAAQRPTPRFSVGDPLPAPELAIGGVPHRFLLSQPDAAQLNGLKAAGVGVVINFRKPAEHPDYDEKAVAADAGLTYCNLPYAGAAEVTDDLLDAARAALKTADQTGDTAALHCRTGNRIGPGWAAYRALDRSIPVDQAIAEAKAMQMLDPKMEDAARNYIRRAQAKSATP